MFFEETPIGRMCQGRRLELLPASFRCGSSFKLSGVDSRRQHGVGERLSAGESQFGRAEIGELCVRDVTGWKLVLLGRTGWKTKPQTSARENYVTSADRLEPCPTSVHRLEAYATSAMPRALEAYTTDTNARTFRAGFFVGAQFSCISILFEVLRRGVRRRK